jgi:hypothetical protein
LLKEIDFPLEKVKHHWQAAIIPFMKDGLFKNEIAILKWFQRLKFNNVTIIFLSRFGLLQNFKDKDICFKKNQKEDMVCCDQD